MDLTKYSLEPSELLDEIREIDNVVEARMAEMLFTYGEARIRPPNSSRFSSE